jgi:hypothetical protein
MDMTIDNEWKLLYSHNPKIQAFAVLKEAKILWQTSNWDLVSVSIELANAPGSAAPSVTINNVEYQRIKSSPTSYIASADKDQGHLLMAEVEKDTWVVAWATADSVAELAFIDVAKTAIQLMRRV